MLHFLGHFSPGKGGVHEEPLHKAKSERSGVNFANALAANAPVSDGVNFAAIFRFMNHFQRIERLTSLFTNIADIRRHSSDGEDALSGADSSIYYYIIIIYAERRGT